MSKLKFLVTFGALFVLAHAADEANQTNQVIPPENHNTSTPVPPTIAPVTTTKLPPTTTTTKTTEKPHPTTTTTPTTTPPPKTTTSAPNTTTSAPTTTTTAPSPKPSPVPVPDPQKGTWKVNYTNSNSSCIIVQMSVQIQVLYNTKDNKTEKGYIDLPVNATSSGNCGNSSQDVTLKWNDDSIVFSFVNSSNTYALKSINITVVPDANFTDAESLKPINLLHTNSEFNVTERKSYKCAKSQTLNLTRPGSNDTAGAILVSQLQLQAFNRNDKFVEAVDCEPYDTPDIIPIAAGIALGILIAFVLIGYLVGRRRSQARGYLSM